MLSHLAAHLSHLCAWGRLLTARGPRSRHLRRGILRLHAHLALCHEAHEVAVILAGNNVPDSLAPGALRALGHRLVDSAGEAATRMTMLLARERAHACRDIPTGLAGRWDTERRLHEAVAGFRRGRTPAPGLLLGDVDHLRAINAKRGRGVGDLALALVARALRQTVGDHGHLGRWGGDEFAVILPGTRAPGPLAEALVRVVQTDCAEAGLPVTISVGWGRLRPDERVGTFHDRVDAACYDAKRCGRNRARSADEPAGPGSDCPVPAVPCPQPVPMSSRCLLIRSARNRLIAARQRRRARRVLRQVGCRDAASGCWQRWYGRARLAELCERGEMAAVMRLDIDAFKQRNDTGGHGAGDQTLHRVADLLVVAIREEDLLCRWDGSGFLLLLPGADARQAGTVALRLCRIGAVGDEGADPTLSIGIAEIRSGDTADGVLGRATVALDRARTDGGDRPVTGA